MDENGALEASRSLLDELDEEPEGGDRGHEHLRDVVVGETVVLEREVLGQEAELGVEGVNQRSRHDRGQGHVHGVVEVHLVDGGDESEEPDGRSADPELVYCEVRGGRSAIWEGANAGRCGVQTHSDRTRIAFLLEVIGDHLLGHEQHHGAVSAEDRLGDVYEELRVYHVVQRGASVEAAV